MENGLHVIEVMCRTVVSLFESSSASLKQALAGALGLRLENNFSLVRSSCEVKTLSNMGYIASFTCMSRRNVIVAIRAHTTGYK